MKRPPPEGASQKTFLPCKIKMKHVIQILKQPLRAVPQRQPFRQQINNQIGKILEKHPRRKPLPRKRQTDSLQLYWK